MFEKPDAMLFLDTAIPGSEGKVDCVQRIWSRYVLDDFIFIFLKEEGCYLRKAFSIISESYF